MLIHACVACASFQGSAESALEGSPDIGDATAATAAAESGGADSEEDANGGSAWLEKAVDWGAPKVAAHIRLAEIALLHGEQVGLRALVDECMRTCEDVCVCM